jgi:5,6-dimethylbenzimidazole synthase
MEFSEGFREDLARLFAWRRDVRRFRTEPVPEALVAELIETAASGPSVGLSEPWRFVRLAGAVARKAALANFETANAEALACQSPDRQETYAGLKLAGMREAPVQFAVFCDDATDKGAGLGAATMPETRRYSVVCAVMQLWLAARARGLGVGWVSILDPGRLARDLDVPATWHLVAYLCLGWPEEEHLDAELERHGWERRSGADARVLIR